MKDVVFTTYSFGKLYCYQQGRLKESILKIYPDANLRFWHDDDGAGYPQPGKPPGAKPFNESMYGFKVHCVRNCINEGFKKVVFLDAAIILEAPIDDVLERAAEIGVLATDERCDLIQFISNKCLEYVGETRETLNLKLIGGSVYVFDFNNPKAIQVFEYWEQLEHAGMFGQAGDRGHGAPMGHRNDETCMSLSLAKYGIESQPFDVLGYHNLGGGNKDAAKFSFYKLHFRGIGKIHDHSLNQTIIPMHGNILDLGCRDFIFTNFFKELEYNVVSVDIGKFDGDYHRVAISSNDGECYVQNERDPDATHITTADTGDPVPMMTLDTFSKHVGVDHWHLIKMDIEGAEYGVLKTAKHPIADQVAVEFHAHCGQRKEDLDALLDELSEYYYIHNRVWDEQHSAGFNYWDVLLISKALR